MATINSLRDQSSATETPKNETLIGKTDRLHNKYLELNNMTNAPSIPTSELNTLEQQSITALEIFQNLGLELESNKQYYKNASDGTILPLLFAGFIYVIYITKTVGQAVLISTIVPEILIATAIFGSMVGFFVYTNNKYHQYKTAEEHHSRLCEFHRPKPTFYNFP